MRTVKILITALWIIGMMVGSPTLGASDMATQEEINDHYAKQVETRTKVHQIKMDILNLEAKLTTTVLLESDRSSLNNLLGDDKDKLRGYQAALHEGLSYLLIHWDQLNLSQRFEVQEEELHPE